MPRTNIDTTNVKTVSANGYNLTDSADFKTLTLGANNGVEFTFSNQDVVIFKNDTGGDADFTVKSQQKDPHSGRNIVVPDDVVTVATGKSWAYSMSESLHKEATNNVCQVDCDVAGKILVLRRNSK